jgi:hypothetical protein
VLDIRAAVVRHVAAAAQDLDGWLVLQRDLLQAPADDVVVGAASGGQDHLVGHEGIAPVGHMHGFGEAVEVGLGPRPVLRAARRRDLAFVTGHAGEAQPALVARQLVEQLADLFQRAAAGAAAGESKLRQHIDRAFGLGVRDVGGQRLQARDGIHQHVDLQCVFRMAELDNAAHLGAAGHLVGDE